MSKFKLSNAVNNLKNNNVFNKQINVEFFTICKLLSFLLNFLPSILFYSIISLIKNVELLQKAIF